jgi:8-oxo-dGTP pyrophosphatase MutT (NUDIX family)
MITEAYIKEKLAAVAHNDPFDIKPARKMAAVLAPLFKTQGEWHLLFTRRSDLVEDHKGQVSFPGGAFEIGDNYPVDTALREAWEEIGLPKNNVEIIGWLPEMPTVTNYLVVPVIGIIKKPFQIQHSPSEVNRVFSIPLEWLADKKNFEMKPYIYHSVQVHDVIYYREYDSEILWGLTARMTQLLLQALNILKE